MGWANVEEEQELDYYSYNDTSMGSRVNNQSIQEQRMEVFQSDIDDDIDSDIDADNLQQHGPKTISERRRAQNEILKSFVADINSQLTQGEVDATALKCLNEEQLSIRDILAREKTALRIINPRNYQTELFQRAKSCNTIAVLDTGSGKTHIATLLLRHTLDEELANRAKGGVHKTAFFLVSFEPLNASRTLDSSKPFILNLARLIQSISFSSKPMC